MLDDFRLKIFLTLVEERSFQRTAAKLGITQPSVSQNIAELEKHLGVKLFIRQRTGVELTSAGIIFKNHALEISARYRRLSVLFRVFEAAVVRIDASPEIYEHITADLLKDFMAVHPEITFESAMSPESADIFCRLSFGGSDRHSFRLEVQPSEPFSATALWSVLSEFLK